MGRICAIKGCSNSQYRLDNWLSQLCDIHGLKFGSCVCKPPFTLFPFPTKKKDIERRMQWTKCVNRKSTSGKNWAPTPNDRICSRHFKDGEPTEAWPNPTEFLGYDLPGSSTIKPSRKPPKVREPYVSKKRKKRILEEIVTETETTLEQETLEKIHVEEHVSVDETVPASFQSCYEDQHHSLKDHTYQATRAKCPGCAERERKIESLEEKLLDIQPKSQLSKTKGTKTPLFTMEGIVMKNDKTCRQYTGMNTKKQFESLHSYLEPKVLRMRYWEGGKKESSPRSTPKGKKTPSKPGPKRSLGSKQEFMLVLMKLRLALTLAFLASVFDISQSRASQIFNTWIKFLASELKHLIFWPDRVAISSFMPNSLKDKYNGLRCTIDCTEIFIERPRNLELQALTWSDYKKHNTVKFLVAIAPNGMISFLSKAWGGRATDVHITRESGFLNLIDAGDIILADRGFVIREDLLMRHARLEIPASSKGLEQQSPEDVAATKKIANARIHVERAIGRMKVFNILQHTLPLSMVPLIDDIVIVCAALINLQPALVK
ncbi:uncharacterized protein [Diadema antillarum]|uniref:uncharacterized protein n=1 Tax=Diadema antillarum TaxID=105358 RepID=UPI003A881130